MADRWQTYPLIFEGGLRSDMSQLEHGMTAPGSARILTNFEPSIEGGYRRIRGYTKYDSQEVPGTNLIRGVFFAFDAVYTVRDNQAYFSGGSGWNKLTDNSTYGSQGVTMSDGVGIVRFESLNFGGVNTVIFCDPVQKPYQYRAGVFSQITTAPNDAIGTTVARVFKNHLFFAGGSSLIFSAPFSTTDYTPASGGGVIDVGDEITGLVSFRDMLIIFTENTILNLQGSSVSDFIISPITRDLGCIRPDTIQEIGGDIIFLGPDGLRLLSATERHNDFGLGIVSKVIQKQVVDFVEANQTFCSVTLPTKSQYRLFGYNPSTINQIGRGIIGMQTASQGGDNMAWSELVGMSARVAYSSFSTAQEVIVFANDNGYVYRMETSNSFDGEDISATFATPYFPITDPSTRKTLYKVDVYTDPQGAFSADLNVSLDYEQKEVIQPRAKEMENRSGGDLFIYDTAVYGDATYSSDDVKSLFSLNLEGSARVFSLRFTSNSSSSPFSLDSVSIQYGQHGRR